MLCLPNISQEYPLCASPYILKFLHNQHLDYKVLHMPLAHALSSFDRCCSILTQIE